MEKEVAFEDFFKSLSRAFKNSSLYFKEHPSLVLSVREVKKKIDVLLDLVSPVKVSFTAESLLAEDKYFDKEKVFVELAQIFHFRKIQSIEIRKGITIEELLTFLTRISLPPEIILKHGGVSSILKEEKVSHLTVQELDYSQLLTGEGDEVENIWPYLLQDAVEQDNSYKLINFADNFDSFLKDMDTEDLVENDDLKINISKLFEKLKNREENKFRKCSKDLLKSLMKNRNVTQRMASDDTKMLFKDLDNDDFASVLWDEISTDESFNPLSFQIFSQLAEKKDQQSIADSFEKISQKRGALSRTPRVRKKITELLTGSSGDIISETYKNTLSSILSDISYEGELTFDHTLLQENYRFMLLYLLSKEKETERAIQILEEILDEWESIINQRDLEFVECLITILDKHRSDLSYDPIFLKVNQQILYFIAEYHVFEEGISSDFDKVKNYLSGTFLGIKAYLDKMFKENKVGAVVLQLFFQIYSESFYLFKKNLMRRSSDIDFLEEITKNLGKVDSPASLESLKFIYSIGNKLIKINALESIQNLSIQDEDFLFDILKTSGISLKKRALQILMRNESAKKRVAEELFSIFSPFGIRNRILLENVRITREMELTKAREELTALSEWKSFWNKNLRGETVKVLNEWDARKS